MSFFVDELAEWIVSVKASDIPAGAKAVASRAFIDTCGVLVAGASDDIAAPVRRWVDGRQRAGGTLVPPFGLETDPEVAALALGILSHALDYDDIHPSTLGHPSTVLVPVVLALGQSSEATGAEAVTAYVVGAEVDAHMGREISPQEYRRGWHTTATIGVLGGTAAAARLLGLDQRTTAHALGLAASAAAGVRANFGSNAKPVHAGQTAAHAVTAALFAADGMTSTKAALDGPLGYLENFAGEREAGSAIMSRLGQQWELIDPGLQVKPYSCCGGGHRSIDALLDIVRREHLVASEVESVTAVVDPFVPTLLVYHDPTTVGEARFSLHHCLAAVLADGELSLKHFTPAAVARSDLKELAKRIHMEVNPELVGHEGGLARADVRVRTPRGQFREVAEHPRGSKERPISQQDLERKFLDCTRMYAPEHDWTAALQTVAGLYPDGSVTAVVKALTTAA